MEKIGRGIEEGTDEGVYRGGRNDHIVCMLVEPCIGTYMVLVVVRRMVNTEGKSKHI